ncbi:MAG: FkbM family methyltransferase [Bacteroidales bacterium]|nr:FkbM family methyltransferase [Bacteroidales bacterium]
MKFRHFVKILFRRVSVNIRSGPLKGKKWSIASGSRFLNGDYERYKTDAFLEHFRPGNIFLDIGAHFGYYSSIAATVSEGEGWIYSLEPRPMNIEFFKRHIEINHFTNVTLIEAAAGEYDGFVQFDNRHGSATGFVCGDGNLKVEQVSVAGLIKRGVLPFPDFIKIDVEGGEMKVLADLEEFISVKQPKMLVATHGKECRDFTETFLRKNNYSFRVLNPEAVSGDTEIIAIPA